jgi:hypothetical protein
MAPLLSACAASWFNTEVASQLGTSTLADSSCTDTIGGPSLCFGDSSGSLFLSAATSLFKPYYTTQTSDDHQTVNQIITATSETGDLYFAYPHLASTFMGNQVRFQLGKLSSDQRSIQNLDFSPITLSNTGSVAVTDLLVDKLDTNGHRYLYYAGTYNISPGVHQFFVCRMVENPHNQFFEDDTFGGGSSNCRDLGSGDLGGKNPRAGGYSPVHLAFHLGTDGVRRVIAVGAAVDVGSVNYVILMPFRTDGTGISGSSAGLNASTTIVFTTAAQGPNFTTSGFDMRKLRVFGLESENPTEDFNPTELYLGLQFENPQNSAGATTFKTWDGQYRFEHFILRLNDELGEDSTFGEPTYSKPGIYIPADETGMTSGIVALNTRPYSTATSIPVMRVNQGSIYLAGLHRNHADLLSVAPPSLFYRLIKFSTLTTSNVPTVSSFTTTATFCNIAATPALALSKSGDNLLIACSQSNGGTAYNYILREHDTSSLAIRQRMGTADGNFTYFGTGFEGLSALSPSLNLYDDDEAGGTFLYTGWIENTSGDFYPAFKKTWHD